MSKTYYVYKGGRRIFKPLFTTIINTNTDSDGDDYYTVEARDSAINIILLYLIFIMLTILVFPLVNPISINVPATFSNAQEDYVYLGITNTSGFSMIIDFYDGNIKLTTVTLKEQESINLLKLNGALTGKVLDVRVRVDLYFTTIQILNRGMFLL